MGSVVGVVVKSQARYRAGRRRPRRDCILMKRLTYPSPERNSVDRKEQRKTGVDKSLHVEGPSLMTVPSRGVPEIGRGEKKGGSLPYPAETESLSRLQGLESW